ncbi:hypothetical protein [Acidisoma sp.]|uniref:hypothetical protein n=1 Tax=Acidisoma sp. TaxID=1872115 RepID=UPI003B00F70A
MSATNSTARDGGCTDDGEPMATPSDDASPSPPAGVPFDWQVLLLRYLPQPVGSTHVIKRLAPR